MGTQQMLMVVMSIIIVGVMLMAGIFLFNLHSYNSNKNNLITEMNTYPPLVLKFYNTSSYLGGANGNVANVTRERVAGYIGFSGPNLSAKSENGEFRVTEFSGRTVVLKGMGVARRNGKNPHITARINLDTKAVTRVVTDSATW